MDYAKETYQYLDENITRIVTVLAPGLMIIEMVFHKGFISGGITDLFSFILLLIWSFVISLPFFHWLGFLAGWFDPFDDPVRKSSATFDLGLPLLFIVMVINYLFYRLIMHWGWLSNLQEYSINPKYVLCIVSTLVSMILSLPISKMYYYFLRYEVIKAKKKERTDKSK
jgi:uncharacterized membrane protein